MGGSLGVSNRISFTALDCSGRRLTLWVTVTFWAGDVEAHVTSRNSPTTLWRIASSTEVSAAILRAQQRPCQAIPSLTTDPCPREETGLIRREFSASGSDSS